MRLHYLVPKTSGIAVLMYHHVLPGQAGRDVIDPLLLRSQWNYLRDHHYHCLSLDQLLRINSGLEKAPAKSFLLTFDDGNINNLQYAYPLLKEFGWSAVFFLIGNSLHQEASAAVNAAGKLNLSQLSSIEPQVVQFGMHGYTHENFEAMNITDAVTVIKQMKAAFDSSGLHYYKVLAYPYGKRPRNWWKKKRLETILKDEGIEAAFRIGNKPQKIPASNLYQLKRIDIRGTDTMEDFRIKLERGKLHPF